jgi:sugar/nucleoside kinase (ribokinase family)
MSIVVVGSIALDTIQTPFGQTKEALGGSATYFSYSASFFSPVGLVGVVGEDFSPNHIRLLKDRGISVEGLEVSSGKTFRWKGQYENDMNTAQTKATELNVFQTFTPKIPQSYRNLPYVFLANIDPDLQLQVLDQMDHPQLVGCDTMNLWISTKKDSLNKLLKKVDIFLLNDAEARQLTGITNLVKAAADLLKRGPNVVVIKKGEHGAILSTKEFIFVAPAFPLEDVFDPTGAGDCFAGGFFSSLTRHKTPLGQTNLRKSIIYGTVMASFNVESFSVERLKTVTPEAIIERYNKFKQHTHFEPADHTTSFKTAALTK